MRIRIIAASAAAVLAPLATVGVVSTAANAAVTSTPVAPVQALASKSAPVLSGGRATATTRHATVSWKCTGTSAFTVTITGPGPLNGRRSTVTKPQAVYTGLLPGHTYQVKIQPLVSGHPAGKSGLVSFRTLYGR
jgi:hypothetical protein